MIAVEPRRRSPFSNLSGPRLPSGPRPLDETEVADPAQGVRVARCFTCGMPAGDEPLMTFALLLLPGRETAGIYRLCGRCWRYANPPESADPVQLTG